MNCNLLVASMLAAITAPVECSAAQTPFEAYELLCKILR